MAWTDSIFGAGYAVPATGLLIGSLVVHELGHMLAAWCKRVPVTGAGISVIGTYIRRRRAASAADESMISLAGPLFSLLLAAGFTLGNGHLCTWLAEMNLILGLSNLIPVAGTDGDRALNALCRATARN